MASHEKSAFSKSFRYRPNKSLECLPTLLLFFAAGCQFQDDRSLVGGYRLTYMNGCEVRIHRDQPQPPTFADEWVDGSVESYAVRGPYITGYADTRCIDADSERKAPGYFLIDTRTQAIQQPLSEQEWRTALKKIGWDYPDLNTVRRTNE